jgi:hypothetical protein
MGSLEPCLTHMDCFQHSPIEIGEQGRRSQKLDLLIFILGHKIYERADSIGQKCVGEK